MTPRSEKTKWKYVGLPDWLVAKIDEAIEKDKYPQGRWHSRDEWVIEHLKQILPKQA